MLTIKFLLMKLLLKTLNKDLNLSLKKEKIVIPIVKKLPSIIKMLEVLEIKIDKS